MSHGALLNPALGEIKEGKGEKSLPGQEQKMKSNCCRRIGPHKIQQWSSDRIFWKQLQFLSAPCLPTTTFPSLLIWFYLTLQFQTFVAITAPLLCSRPLYWTSLYIHTVHKLHQGSLEDKLWPMLLSGPEITCLVWTRVLESSKTSQKVDHPRRDPAH